MPKRATKVAIKRAAYEKTMASQPTKAKVSKARWIKHSWDEKTDTLRTQWQPGFFPAKAGWHREGSIDEIEQRENAGQREMF
ncbi:hypothetical protein [Rhizobium lentis]|uniref:hypothetical protein n=1 Tax=Rhizobium lentis TaxID=1138194 RepID=UPI001C82A738|nr:hypothetical protein [Rhizobium lentis]